jgi:hypothetical protein
MGQKELSIEKLRQLIVSRDNKNLSSSSEDKGGLIEVDMASMMIGPILIKDLRDHLREEGIIQTTAKIRSVNERNWVPLFNHPLFSEKEKVNVNTPIKENGIEEYFIIKDGRRLGPFSQKQIEKKLDENDLLFTDIISTDFGETWNKLFLLKTFDRRRKKEADLPHSPTNFTETKVDKSLNSTIPSVDEDEVIVSLAHLGTVRSPEEHLVEQSDFSKDVKEKGVNRFIYLLIFIAASILLITVGKKYFPSLGRSFSNTKDAKEFQDRPLSNKSDQKGVKRTNQLSNPFLPKKHTNIESGNLRGREHYNHDTKKPDPQNFGSNMERDRENNLENETPDNQDNYYNDNEYQDNYSEDKYDNPEGDYQDKTENNLGPNDLVEIEKRNLKNRLKNTRPAPATLRDEFIDNDNYPEQNYDTDNYIEE